MDAQSIKQKLDQLAELRSAADAILLHKKEAYQLVITPEIQAQINEIDVEFDDKADVAIQKADALESEIKADVIQYGATVKGQFYQMVWNKGRVSWDTKGLDGFLIAHPEIAAFRKEGDPSCTLRKV